MSTAHYSRSWAPPPPAQNTKRHTGRYGLAFAALALFDLAFIAGTPNTGDKLGVLALLSVNVWYTLRAAQQWRDAK